jgi:hypothetical protein
VIVEHREEEMEATRCVLLHRVSILPNVQLTTGREETVHWQSISFALQQNTLNFSIMFPKRRPTPDPHLLTRFNGFVSCHFFNTYAINQSVFIAN